MTRSSYYQDKTATLGKIFGASSVEVQQDGLLLDGRFLPVVDDVIVALDRDRVPAGLRPRLPEGTSTDGESASTAFAADIQYTFGEEWKAHPGLLRDHETTFRSYFDLIDLDGLAELRVADLGCGMGRWSHFIAPRCREIVLVDFSEAIFVARQNLSDARNAIFVMADVLALPFADDSFDLTYCLGVLHHLPVDALDALRRLSRLAPRQLAYLYYDLDNRPAYFRSLLHAVTAVRRRLATVRSPRARSVLTWTIATTVYAPLAALGSLLRPVGLSRFVPMAEAYGGASMALLRQDAYDRFFTGIEQRFTKDQILTLEDTFGSVTVSEGFPYWHFRCDRSPTSGTARDGK